MLTIDREVLGYARMTKHLTACYSCAWGHICKIFTRHVQHRRPHRYREDRKATVTEIIAARATYADDCTSIMSHWKSSTCFSVGSDEFLECAILLDGAMQRVVPSRFAYVFFIFSNIPYSPVALENVACTNLWKGPLLAPYRQWHLREST